jgi:hypothetical protein
LRRLHAGKDKTLWKRRGPRHIHAIHSMRFLPAFIFLLATAALASEEPSASEILANARLNPLGGEIALRAQLRAGSVKVPFTIDVRGGRVAYIFESPLEEIILRFGKDSARLERKSGASAEPVPAVQMDDPVRGGLITLGDLALEFLYWKNPKLLGSETVRSRDAWKIELHAPNRTSQYAAVRVWIDKQSSALLRIEGYNRSGILAKRFEVVSAQKIDGQWMLRQMRVERIDPATRKTTGITYLEVLDALRSAPAAS